MAKRRPRRDASPGASKESRRSPHAGHPVSGPGAARLAPAGVVVGLLLVVVIVYARIVGAGFVEYDDDIHVYANPLLDPLSLENVGSFWRHAYRGLYIPLAYTILAVIASLARVPAQAITALGQTVALDPGVFHAASLVFHAANTLLAFALAQRLTRSRGAAALGALVFALHPLQVESVAWISEWRGLTSACFGLAALNLVVLSRQASDPTRRRVLQASSAALALGAMLCKPAAMVLPLIVLVIDRVALGTSWRRALSTAGTWAACVLPLAVVTRSVQEIHPLGRSLWWQRPFVAGDALVFYLRKTVLPLDLGVEFGRTPRAVLSHGYSYVAWLFPAALLLLGFVYRRRRPVLWLGSLLFVVFLLPTLGLIPFTYQAQSTVACRYAYLPLLGVGLMAGELFTAAHSRLGLKVAALAASVVIVTLALLSFHQSGYWADNTAFLDHTIEVNPNVAFAQNNLGSIALMEGRLADAVERFEHALELDPDDAKAENNLGLALVRLGRLEDAEPHYRRAVALDPRYVKALENLAAVYLQTGRPEEAIGSLKAALVLLPAEAKAWNDLGVAYMQSGRAEEGVDGFRRAVGLEPDNTQYRNNLGRALAQQGQGEPQNSMRTPRDGSTIR